MKLITIALAGVLFNAAQATTNFKSTCGAANNQMASLATYISQVKAIADRNGHAAISAKCNEASRHLVMARSSWNSVSSKFGNFPWEARFSTQGNTCQSRLSSCGSCIDWIFSRPEIPRFPAYRIPLLSCRSGHRGCQTTCGQVWNWPSPPGYHPKPSGYRRYRREASKTLCPANETACPIAAGAPGHECVNIRQEITSCGGCTTKHEGENCLAIEGADEVGCDGGHCRVFTALPGYEMNPLTKRPMVKAN